jgi:hypothetical protein
MHKNNAQLFLQKLKDKLPKKTNKRTFQKIELENDKYTIEETDQALEGCFLTIRLIPQEEIASIQVFIEELPESLVSKLENVLKQKKGFKLQVVLTAKFKKFHPATGTEEFDELPVPSKNRNIFREDEIKVAVSELLNEIHEKIESWDNKEGYWHLESVIHIDLKIREYKPLSGSSYIQTPKWISDKKATINIKNEDQKCFKYCMLYHKHKNEIKCHPERLYHYKKWMNSEEFNFDIIKFPVEVNDLKKFCKQNDVSINVYVVNSNEIVPHLTCARDERKSDHINLLLLKDDEKSHYIYINDLSKLVGDQITKREHHFMQRINLPVYVVEPTGHYYYLNDGNRRLELGPGSHFILYTRQAPAIFATIQKVDTLKLKKKLQIQVFNSEPKQSIKEIKKVKAFQESEQKPELEKMEKISSESDKSEEIISEEKTKTEDKPNDQKEIVEKK